jgi:hypothetical protein
MSNKRITDLTELTNPTTDDVFPVVDIATNTTTKVQLGNLPVPSSVTTALATKQDTLVSGTNIKTLNNTSLLGSGNITLNATPSGVAGAIQFSNGSAFASDASNLFWDDINNRLGVGTNVPTATGHLVGSGTTSATTALLVQNNSALIAFRVTNDAKSSFGGLGNNGYFGINRESDGSEMGSISTTGNGINIRGGASFINCNNNYSNTIGASSLALGAMWGIRGSGSTSATTSLLVQNSVGTSALTIKDDLTSVFGGQTTIGGDIIFVGNLVRTSRGRINFYGGDGEITLTNSTESSFNVLRLGGLTSSFPAIKRNGTAIDFRLADDSAFAPINAGATTFSDNALFSADFKSIGRDLNNSSIRFSSASSEIRANISTGGQFHVYNAGSGTSRFAVSNGGQTTISGGGSTSATTSLLVQNSAGNPALQVDDDRGITLAGSPASGFVINATGSNAAARFGACAIGTWGVGGIFSLGSTNSTATRIATNNIAALYLDTNQSVNVGTVAAVASAQLQVDSTTKGFLPPRMTTTQKNAISSPAAGLVVYDSTTNKLCCYNGSTWNDLF